MTFSAIPDDRFGEESSGPSDEVHMISHHFQHGIIGRTEDFAVVREKGGNVMGFEEMLRFPVFI